MGKVGAESWGRWEQRVGEGGSRGLGKVGAEGWGRWKQRVGEGGSRGFGKVGAEGWGRWEQRVGEGGSRGLGKVEAEGWGRWEQRVGEGGSRGLGKVGAEGWGRWKQRVGEGGSRGLEKRVGEGGSRGLGKVEAEGWGRWEQRVGEGGSRGLGKVEAEGWGRWEQRVKEGGAEGWGRWKQRVGARGSLTQRCLSEYNGAQIIDLMLLVVDVTKGIQTQTAECLVIGEITCDHMIVVLNKTDLVEPSKRENHISKVLSRHLFVPQRSGEGSFLYAVDHCFPIRGQGTVMTGTVLRGSVQVNDTVEIPFLKTTKKVKSMQMFHQPVQQASQGDRVGICVTQFDAKLMERCLVCAPGGLPSITAGIIQVYKIPYHKSPCTTGSKFHITIGHETVMAKTTFFGCEQPPSSANTFDVSRSYLFQEQILESAGKLTKASSVAQPSSVESSVVSGSQTQYALLEFEKPVICAANSLVIGARLDIDAFSNTCRIAFHGVLLPSSEDLEYQKSFLPQLKVYKLKTKEGVVERIQDEKTVIGRGLFKRETKIQSFLGLTVKLSSGELGIIEGAFGTSGKFRVNIPDGLRMETQDQLKSSKKKGKTKEGETSELEHSSIKITMTFKRYVFDPEKKLVQ
ncbi:hypothetical protein EMCRGX_G023569 [Ephydatia muelleri]